METRKKSQTADRIQVERHISIKHKVSITLLPIIILNQSNYYQNPQLFL